MNAPTVRSTGQPTGGNHPTTAPTRTDAPTRWSAAAAVTYLTAWVIGLIAGPAAPSPAASDAEIHAHYLTEQGGVLMQSLLVHGIAGIALGVMAVAIPAATAATGVLRHTIIGAGLAAALTSLLQAGLAVAAVTGTSTGEPAASAGWFAAINAADTIKLMLLAGFVAATSSAVRRGRRTPGWVSALAAALVILLPLGGTAFLVPGPVLTALLYLSLPILLVWVAATALVISRRPAPTQ